MKRTTERLLRRCFGGHIFSSRWVCGGMPLRIPATISVPAIGGPTATVEQQAPLGPLETLLLGSLINVTAARKQRSRSPGDIAVATNDGSVASINNFAMPLLLGRLWH